MPHDRSEPVTTQDTTPGLQADKGGIGFGLFLILARLILLAWGAGELYRRLGAR